MTAHKHLKQLVRARMRKTGESYASARRHVLTKAGPADGDPVLRWHFPGNVPAPTALRVLLAHAGVRAPHTGEPFSEAMLFGLAGGIGIGVFSFYYEKENIASFFVAGRHLWHDHLAYLRRACERLGLSVEVRESGGAKTAEQHLRDLLLHGPCVAWVDAVRLPHRAVPTACGGGSYHVVTVYRIDEAGTALVGDLTDEPIPVPLAALAEARAGIKKDRNRLLRVTGVPGPIDLAAAVRDGLRACVAGLTGEGAPKSARSQFSLDAIGRWAERLHGSKDKERWERVFPPGGRLWQGLVSVHEYIEHYGTGGGLCRPLFADFLTEASVALGRPELRSLAERYADLGRAWGELAEAALPDDVPELREARELHALKAELRVSGGPDAVDAVRAAWDRLGELGRQARDKFPLTDADCAALRARLQARVAALYEGERAAHAALAETAAGL
jgi:hypothetical protein